MRRFSALVATKYAHDSGAVKHGEAVTAAPAAAGWRRWVPSQRIYPLLIVFGLAFAGTGVLPRQTLHEFPEG
jgi:hypothetical protein